MKKLVFASHNSNKAKEISAILSKNLDSNVVLSVSTLDEMGLHEDIDETADTLEGNAIIKAQYAFDKTGIESFADDTGLEVEALNGAPGVHTARFADETCDPEKNMAKLLDLLHDCENRKARFRTVVAYISSDGQQHLFEGIVEGRIAMAKAGTQGFGYDPVFIPDENNPDGLTFAQMGLDVKNVISHRARAIAKFDEYIKKLV